MDFAPEWQQFPYFMDKLIANNTLCMNCMADKGPVSVCPYCHFAENAIAENAAHLPYRTLLHSRYIIGKCLTRTPFSITYLGFDPKSERKVRIREFFPESMVVREKSNLRVLLRNPDFKEEYEFGIRKFTEETQALAAVKAQPGIAHIVDNFQENGTIYRVSIQPEGQLLSDLLEEDSLRPPREKLLTTFRPLMLVLEQLHSQGLLHYALTPQNIVIGDDNIATLVNFSGTDAILAHHTNTLSQFLDSEFAPPEFYDQIESARPGSDVYALGAILFRLITGKPLPKPDQRPDELFTNESVATGVPRVVLKALSYATFEDTEKRFKQIGHFRLVLTEVWRSRKSAQSTIAKDAFSYVDCNSCGIMNEVLTTDLESGTSTCFACGQQLVLSKAVDHPTARQTIHPPDKQFTLQSTGSAFFEVRRKAPTDEPEFVKVACPVCKAPNEVLVNELGSLAHCVTCGTPLPKDALEIIEEYDFSLTELLQENPEDVPEMPDLEAITAATEIAEPDSPADEKATETEPVDEVDESVDTIFDTADTTFAEPDVIDETDTETIDKSEIIDEKDAESIDEPVIDDAAAFQPEIDETESVEPEIIEEPDAETASPEEKAVTPEIEIPDEPDAKPLEVEDSAEESVVSEETIAFTEPEIFDEPEIEPAEEPALAAETPEVPEQTIDSASIDSSEVTETEAPEKAAVTAATDDESAEFQWEIELDSIEKDDSDVTTAPPKEAEPDSGVDVGQIKIPEKQSPKSADEKTSGIGKSSRKSAASTPLAGDIDDILDRELGFGSAPAEAPEKESAAKVDKKQKVKQPKKTASQPQPIESETPPVPETKPVSKAKWPWLAAIFVVILFSTGGTYYWQLEKQATADRMFQDYVQKADQFFEQKDYAAASTSYQQALIYKPEAEYPQKRLVESQDMILAELRADTTALAALDSVEVRLSNLLFTADSLENAGRLNAAGEMYQQILAEFPGDSVAAGRLADLNRKIATQTAPVRTQQKPAQIELRPEDDLAGTVAAAPPFATFRLARGIYEITDPIIVRFDMQFEGIGGSYTTLVSQTGNTIFQIENGAKLSIKDVGFSRQQAKSGATIIAVNEGELQLRNGEFRDAQSLSETLDYCAVLFSNRSKGEIRDSKFTNHAVGIIVGDDASPRLEKNEFWQNMTAIHINGSARPRIRVNQIRRNFGDGIVISEQGQPILEENLITENRGNGIVFNTERFSGTAKQNTVNSNKGAGVLIDGTSQPILENNEINLNESGGVLVQGTAQGIVRENRIERNSIFGIRSANASSPQLQRNTIKNNKGDGIEVLNQAKPSIQGNEILQNRGDGISLLITQNGGLIQNNTCRGNQGYGISILKGSRPNLVNNSVAGNYEGDMYDETAEIK